MKNKTIIIGERSNLTQRLKLNIKNCEIISATQILNNNKINRLKKNEKINLIINSFYPSSQLKNKIDYKLYIEQSLLTLGKVLKIYKVKNINKIIYSSSSSIYNLTKLDLDGIQISSKDIYSLTKLLSEKILINFSKINKVNLTIARLYNIYGGDDRFSIIHNIIKAYKGKKPLIIFNNGEAIRDFIHVDEVCEIYLNLINKKKNQLICDIGKGFGFKIKDIIKSIGLKNFIIKKKYKSEQTISIAKKNQNSKKDLRLTSYISNEIGKKKINKIKKYFVNIDQAFINKKIEGSIIYGAGNAGKQVCDLILEKKTEGIFCFVDDDPKKIGKSYKGKKIISKEDLYLLALNRKVPNIILAIPSLSSQKIKILFNELHQISSSVNNLPLKSEINTDIINLNDLQNSEFISIFEKKKSTKTKNFYSKLKNKNILVTGAGGSIGAELVFQLAKIIKKKIICLDFSEYFLFKLKNNIGLNQNKIKLILGDINDTNLIKKTIKENKIDLIFHAAAYKHLDFLENNPKQAIKNNILGTYNLINSVNAATSKKVKMINISTDKAVKPTSVLGISKRIAEIICQNSKFNYQNKLEISTVRFGNVFGSRGSVINLFLEKINNGENVNLTDKRAKRYFMSINEACNLVIAASLLNKNFKTFILDMGKPINIKNLLSKIIKLKRKTDKNFQIKINETGLKKGEKLKEELSISKKIKKTNISRILEVNEPSYSLQKINNLLLKIKKILDTKTEKKLIPEIKYFLKDEV